MVGSDRRCTRHDNKRIPKASGRIESHRNKRDYEVMHVWDCMVEGRLIRIVRYYLYQQDSGCYKWYQRRPLSVRCGSEMNHAEAGGHVTSEADEAGEWSPVGSSSLWMGDILGSFPESVRVRTKHVEKTRAGLWGQSTILIVVWDVTLLRTAWSKGNHTWKEHCYTYIPTRPFHDSISTGSRPSVVRWLPHYQRSGMRRLTTSTCMYLQKYNN
ncbi:hypothetical protein MTR_4g081990 [Medicago truncatula]|uniref:Uncharacterized protein n=1 Tax=Medicago truncatula TaxID=3880 RepID=G7JG90_MEDTR|nr:hypothetical protein MTR_4g081990 [Medicago truncatula]